MHAATYSSVLTCLKAVQLGRTDSTPDVMAQMEKTTINDVFAVNGKLRDDNKMVHDVYVMEVKKPSEFKAPWNYQHVRHTIPANEAPQALAKLRCPMVTKPF